MPEYNITFQEIVSYEVTITADSKDDAQQQFFDDMYYNDSNITDVETSEFTVKKLSTVRRMPSNPDTTNSTIIHPKPCP